MEPIDARQLLEIAMELEESLGVCYELMATFTGGPEDPVTRFLAGFAAQEDEHYHVFHRMLLDLQAGGGAIYRPLTDAQRQQVKDLIENKITPSLQGIYDIIQHQDMTLDEALALTVATERDTVVFYTGMLLAINDPHHAAILQKIIDDEKRHEQELLARRETLMAERKAG